MSTTSQKAFLGDREREVLRLIADGLIGKEIAVKLGISLKTVEFHKTKLYRKIGAQGVVAATRYALREGYLLDNPKAK